jgi:hypothetical protein
MYDKDDILRMCREEPQIRVLLVQLHQLFHHITYNFHLYIIFSYKK